MSTLPPPSYSDKPPFLAFPTHWVPMRQINTQKCTSKRSFIGIELGGQHASCFTAGFGSKGRWKSGRSPRTSGWNPARRGRVGDTQPSTGPQVRTGIHFCASHGQVSLLNDFCAFHCYQSAARMDEHQRSISEFPDNSHHAREATQPHSNSSAGCRQWCCHVLALLAATPALACPSHCWPPPLTTPVSGICTAWGIWCVATMADDLARWQIVRKIVSAGCSCVTSIITHFQELCTPYSHRFGYSCVDTGGGGEALWAVERSASGNCSHYFIEMMQRQRTVQVDPDLLR